MCLYKAGEGKTKEIHYLTGLAGVTGDTRMLVIVVGIWKSYKSFAFPLHTQKYNSTNISVTGNNSIFSASKKSRNLAFLKMKAEIRFVI